MDEIPEAEVQMEKQADKQFCMNCSSEIAGRFCSTCGQDSRPFRRSFGGILKDFAEAFFDLDGKVVKSIIPLLFYPGRLSIDFLRGKRRSQVNPFQLYAFFSLLFFLSTFEFQKAATELQGEGVNVEINSSAKDSALLEVYNELIQVKLKKMPESFLSQYDSVQKGLSPDNRDPFYKHIVKKRIARLLDHQRKEKDFKGFIGSIGEIMIENLPNTLILLLPVLALLLKLLYYRRHLLFVDSLIFSIHLFCFVFVLGVFMNLLGEAMPEFIFILILLFIPLYFLLAMKRFFRQSWAKTAIKLFLLGSSFSAAAILALMLNFLFAALFQY